MIGPSSSHTAGACRLGLLAAAVLGKTPSRAVILLHGSFAHTYKGHGTDRALAAGLMGWKPDDARIPDALEVAEKRGLKYNFATVNLGAAVHPNTVCFQLYDDNGDSCKVIGSSIGGGQVQVTSIDDFPVELTGVLPTLLIPHKDVPGVVALVSTLLAMAGVNIASMRVFRTNKGGMASMVMECDQPVSDNVLQELAKLEPVYKVRFVGRVV